ncbi:hypothetical protein [Micromonospora sp. NPDC085948]|uniref:hypothetical protein n=1 Tax=Micromonospora sp. NPDC085948 TaxID=3155293 RepID=UPI0034405370
MTGHDAIVAAVHDQFGRRVDLDVGDRNCAGDKDDSPLTGQGRRQGNPLLTFVDRPVGHAAGTACTLSLTAGNGGIDLAASQYTQRSTSDITREVRWPAAEQYDRA